MNINKEFVKRNFSKHAAAYDEHSRIQRRVAFELVSRAKNFKGLVLDIGAGTGFIRENSELDLIEIDISEKACKLNSGDVICADAENLPFADNSFDNIISSLTLQWLDDAKAASEIFRVLKKGGRIQLATFGAASLNELKSAYSFLDTEKHIVEFGSSMKYFAAFKMAGFDKINIESQKITYLHENIFDLLRSIKNVGASYPMGSKGLKGKKHFERLENIYRAKFTENKQLKLSWEVLFISGVKK